MVGVSTRIFYSMAYINIAEFRKVITINVNTKPQKSKADYLVFHGGRGITSVQMLAKRFAQVLFCFPLGVFSGGGGLFNG